MSKVKQKRLVELDRSDFEIIKDDPDIRGWDVRSRTGHKIGSVEELIVDTLDRKIRYMIVDLDENELKLGKRKVLVPIGLAELHAEYDDVLIPEIPLDMICQLPDYDRNNLTPEVVRSISYLIANPQLSTTTSDYSRSNKNRSAAVADEEVITDEDIDTDFYNDDMYNSDHLYRNRRSRNEAAHANEVKYEKNLRINERDNQDGTINSKYRDLSDEERRELVRSRRNYYKQRRYES